MVPRSMNIGLNSETPAIIVNGRTARKKFKDRKLSGILILLSKIVCSPRNRPSTSPQDVDKR